MDGDPKQKRVVEYTDPNSKHILLRDKSKMEEMSSDC